MNLHFLSGHQSLTYGNSMCLILCHDCTDSSFFNVIHGSTSRGETRTHYIGTAKHEFDSAKVNLELWKEIRN